MASPPSSWAWKSCSAALSSPQFSVAYLTGEFEQAEKGIRGGVFPASPGEHCGRCGVNYACTEANGPKAIQLDPNYPAR
jgi:hypothetical protein